MTNKYERKEGFVMIQNDIFKMELDPLCVYDLCIPRKLRRSER